MRVTFYDGELHTTENIFLGMISQYIPNLFECLHAIKTMLETHGIEFHVQQMNNTNPYAFIHNPIITRNVEVIRIKDEKHIGWVTFSTRMPYTEECAKIVLDALITYDKEHNEESK